MGPSFLPQLEAKRDFFKICRDVVASSEKAYVKDKAGVLFMTLAPSARRAAEPVVDVTAQTFRDNFSRFCSLVKDGLSFKITTKSGDALYARRHTSYIDPLDAVIVRWRRAIVAVALEEVLTDLRHETAHDNADKLREKVLRNLSVVAERLIGARESEHGHQPDASAVADKPAGSRTQRAYKRTEAKATVARKRSRPRGSSTIKS